MEQLDVLNLHRKLVEAEAQNKKLERNIRIIEKRKEVIKANAETQYSLTKNIASEKQKQELYVKLLLRSHPDIFFVFDENANFLLGTDSICKIINVNNVSMLKGRKFSSIVETYKPPVFTREVCDFIQNNFLNENKSTNNSVDEKFEIELQDNKYEIKIIAFNNDFGVFAGFLIVI